MDHTTIAVDLSKSVFEIAVSRRAGHVTGRHRLPRSRLVPFFAERHPATVLLEACGSAHHWGRRLQELGHHVLLLSPHAVRPYVLRNKTDRADAKGLLEAFRNQEIRPVPVKSVAQQTLAVLHRLRRLGAISKRGDAYLRMLLIHGARGVLAQAGSSHPYDRLRAWALDVQRRRGHNKAAVALANKIARLVWAVWKHNTNFQEVAMA